MYSHDFAPGLTERTSQRWRAAGNKSTVLRLTSPEIQLLNPLPAPEAMSLTPRVRGGMVFLRRRKKKQKDCTNINMRMCGRQQRVVLTTKNPIFRKPTGEDSLLELGCKKLIFLEVD